MVKIFNNNLDVRTFYNDLGTLWMRYIFMRIECKNFLVLCEWNIFLWDLGIRTFRYYVNEIYFRGLWFALNKNIKKTMCS